MTRVYVEPELLARIADEADPNGILAARYAAKARAADSRHQNSDQRHAPPAPAPRHPRHAMGISRNPRLQQPGRATVAHYSDKSRTQTAITFGCHAAKFVGAGLIGYILAGAVLNATSQETTHGQEARTYAAP